MGVPDDVQPRTVAKTDSDFVIFRVGMRVHKLLRLHEWLPIFYQITKMVQDLDKRDTGLLGWDGHIGIRSHEMIQYWRSVEELQEYALDPDEEHYPAWQKFIKDSNDTTGVWHETYHVNSDQYETAYRNMPSHGLADATRRVVTPERNQSVIEQINYSSNDSSSQKTADE